MQNNIVYLYPAQEKALESANEQRLSIAKVARAIVKIVDLVAAVGIFLCIGVCTLLFFTML